MVDDSDHKFTIDDAIRITGGSKGNFQTRASMCFIVIFAVGSQFFYSIPFYMLYPALNCFDENGTKLSECVRKHACDSKKNETFKIDWSD